MTNIILFLVTVTSLQMGYVDGCLKVRISSTCPPGFASPITTYSLTSITSSGHPVYRSDTSDLYMYCINCRNNATSRWVVSDTVGDVDGYIMYAKDSHYNADEITGAFYVLEYGVWRKSPDVKISCTAENVALGKPASQSSTDGSHVAASAVDGDKGTSVPGNQCTLTNPEDGPWWQVDLEKDWPVGSVRVLNRGDCCGNRLHNFEVRVNRDGGSSELCGAPYSGTPTNGQSITVHCGRPIIGRYVRVQLPGKSEALSLCEVEIFPSLGCPTGYIVHGGVCYKPYNIPKTRQDALATCQLDGGSLAMPRHRHTNMFLRKLAVRADIVSPYWIGLSKDNEAWVWEDGYQLCGFKGWASGYPSTANNCTVLRLQHAGGSWENRACETPANFICQMQPPVDLAAVGYRQYGRAYLQAFSVKKTFDEAVAACERFYGGRLAQPATEEFNDRLKGIVGEESAEDSFWIGMKNYEDLHSWLDGTPVSHVNWAHGEPSGDGCVTMTSHGNWRTVDCKEKSFFVCQIGDESLCELEPPSKVQCGGTTSGSSGQISSPGYGDKISIDIPDNLDCEWKITVPYGQVVQITIEDFRLEEDGFLEIFDNCPFGYLNENLTSPNVSSNSTITTSTNIATLVFHSKGLKPKHGFNITFLAVDPPYFRPRNRPHQADARPNRMLKGLFDSFGLKGIIDFGIDILSRVSEVVMNILDHQEAYRRHQELVNLMTQLKNDINSLSNQITEEGIIAELRHEEEIAAIKYSASVEIVKNYLDTLNTRLHVTVNGTLRPEALAQSWADAVLQQDSEGMNQALNSLYGMIMGSSTVFQGRPFMETISALLRRQNLPSSEYRRRLMTVFEYIMDLQAGGYAAWILALKQNGQTDQISEVLRRGHAKLSEQSCLVAPLFYEWPAGTYGLPMTTGGCPLGWAKDGQYTYRGDNSFHFQEKPPVVHFNGSISNNTLAQGYCMKTNSSEGDSDNTWPKGSYCILKRERCPVGFVWGKLGFPGGTQTGVVPGGSFDGDSIDMEYCCRDDGFASLPIRLPLNPPFYLLRFGGYCQQVEEMNVREEWIEYRGNGYRAGVIPDDSGDDNSHKLYYCLYSLPGSVIPTTPIVPDATPAPPNNDNMQIVLIVAPTVAGAVFMICVCVCVLCLCRERCCDRPYRHF
ncbi:uncharacterized protein LOC118430053 [Branchiostoma floridae]|uniref:Uncharacterized protein LOC118430053 n=1 Tax=Branchiostoma floridae TaxID=7739 RepID=A0A9J7M8E6_BRAFL|nr:uncharacterized protein LOC118430053 [Branchiostoma floridae]